MKWRFSLKCFGVVCLGLSFFGFIDNHFRGWDDTNQYFLEGQQWVKKQTPPSPLIFQDKEWLGVQGPAYYPPLTSYSWSWLGDEPQRVRALQASLLFFVFTALVFFYFKRGSRFLTLR